MNRRNFIRGASAAAASASLLGAVGWAAEEEPSHDKPAGSKRKIKLGVIGAGGRGSWLTGLFKEHGGYDLHAVADYFQAAADASGNAVGVDKSRRFSGLSGYKKLIDSGVEAVVVINVPHFHPEHVRAAVDAGCHVYIAKPVAIDVPGCLEIEAAGKKATKNGQCVLVDYQIPTDPINIEVVKRIHDGGVGKLTVLNTVGSAGGKPDDPPKTGNLEDRLRHLIWCADIALGGDYILNYDIHSIDVAVWALGKRPLSAVGASDITRPEPHGDARDVCEAIFECPDGVIWSHDSINLPDHRDNSLMTHVHGRLSSAQIAYWGKSFLRGGPGHYAGGEIENLYLEGAKRNIAAFHDSIVGGKCDNKTVSRAVDGTLAAILGREATIRRVKLTMDELIRENKKLEVDLSGLKA